MANPRKFSEKIALHNKKQAEETAAFEAVLREVSATTQVCLMLSIGNQSGGCHWQLSLNEWSYLRFAFTQWLEGVA